MRYETLRRHYGQYVRAEGDDQLAKIAAYSSGTNSVASATPA
jgi:hypothetical protein